jgi:hypothetical protein
LSKNFTAITLIALLTGLLVSSCSPSFLAAPTITAVPPTETPLPTATAVPPTETAVPTGTPSATPEPTITPTLIPPLAEYNGIPIMPAAITGMEFMGDYQFTTLVSAEKIIAYYERELVMGGWKIRADMKESIPTDMAFQKNSLFVFFKISFNSSSSRSDGAILTVCPFFTIRATSDTSPAIKKLPLVKTERLC